MTDKVGQWEDVPKNVGEWETVSSDSAPKPKEKKGVGGILQESQEAYKTSPAARFKETFSPLKAITQEGIIPQLYQYSKRKATGEAAPKAGEPDEAPVPLMKSLSNMVSYAKKDPGAFAGHVANAIVADPELLVMPEFIPARVTAGMGKVSAAVAKTADAATQAAAVAAGQSAARQLNERGSVDMNVLRQEVKNAAVLSGGARAVGATVAPGVARAEPEARAMMQEARARGYTLPISELSPLGALIDRYYNTPLDRLNSRRFVQEITAETGSQVDRINPTTLTRIRNNLRQDVNTILSPHDVQSTPALAQRIRGFLGPNPDRDVTIDRVLADAETGNPIAADRWHRVRSELSDELNGAIRRQNRNEIVDARAALQDWDALLNQIPQNAREQFEQWRGRYTAFKDIEDAIQRNPTAFASFQRGRLDPQDLLNSMRSRRESETTYLNRQRPQTETALLASGLNLLGSNKPYAGSYLERLIATIPKVATAAVAKPVQAAMYSRPGQYALYQGLEQGRVAPYIGPAVQRTKDSANSK
jgi:hypothetical protein